MARHGRQVPISSKNNRAARSAHARAKEAVKTYDTSAIRPKMRVWPIVVLVAVVIALVIAIAVVLFNMNADGPTLAEGEEAIVTIDQGEGASEIADSLLKSKVIGNSRKFLDLVNSKNAAASLIPGTYLFKGVVTPDGVLEILMTGPSATADALSIPEGFTRAQVAKQVDSATRGRISEQAFLDATANASTYAGDFTFLESAGENSLEGFLFPKTYSVTAGDDAQSVARMMLSQFQKETEGLDYAYPNQEKLTLYDVVKLASIVEKEGKVENYATIAGVFYNRLASDRPYLESDATTAYEVGHDPTGEEVHANTPYSTYANPGLPPTPICNPSLAALQAVCQPEETDYMYFYSNPDGSYSFSVTYDQHQQTYS